MCSILMNQLLYTFTFEQFLDPNEDAKPAIWTLAF